jgi:hypothetical protein
MARNYHGIAGKMKRGLDNPGNKGAEKREGPRLGIQGPEGHAPVTRPRRDRIMGSSIQLPSQRQVGTTHTIPQVGPFLPTYWTMRIVLERDPRRT